MENSIFHRLSSLLWGLVVTLTVLFAIYVSVGRLVASNVGHYSGAILAELNSRVPFTVEAEKVAGEWHSFTPKIVLSGLRITMPGAERRPLELSRGSIGLDVLASLRTGSLQATRLELHGLHLSGQLDQEQRFRLTGFTTGGETGRWLEEFLLNIERVTLTQNALELVLPSGESRLLDLELDLSRSGSQRYLDAALHSTRGAAIRVLGEGLGNPFQPDRFSGELYLDITTDDAAAMLATLGRQSPPLWADGSVNIAVWLNWDRGNAGVEASVEGTDLRLLAVDGGWELPLQQVALEASLLERKNRRTVYISDLVLTASDQTVRLPRLQADFWGDAVRLRARDVDLMPVNTLATSFDLMPAALADVFRTLNPRGLLDSVQLYVGDIAAPGSDWAFEANFSAVDVDSWRGAPGVTSGSGYVELADGGGFVLLDGTDFSLTFPTVYRASLDYGAFNGTFDIGWDEAGLQISSGLVTATDEAGTARLLFGLAVPFQPSEPGIEMDLMVGLEDTRPGHRAKYLPYILDPGLLAWLSSSVGEGLVEQAGFVWRGSLRPGAGALRTIQLGLNIADTRLEYDPDWPALEDFQGILLIDDTEVSVWSESARLYGSELYRLSAESWKDPSRGMMLAVDGRLRGPAADGMAVLDNSPLRQYLGRAFADWQLSGELETDIGLLLSLGSGAPPPDVDVITRWQEVDVAIGPVDLSVEDVNGLLGFASRTGFRSENLVGELWSSSLGIEVRHSAEQPEAGQTLPPVEVNLDAEIDLADIREWLDLDLLRFASGRAGVDLQVSVAAGQVPRLSATSDLAGVSLDLPPPWQTGAEQRRNLVFEMPLGGDQTRMAFTLEGGIDLALQLEGGALSAGALVFNGAPPIAEKGRFRIGGALPLLDVDAWNRFLAQYLSLDLLQNLEATDPAGDPGQSTGAAGATAVGETAMARLVPGIDELLVERVLVGGREFEAVTIGLEPLEDQWRLAAQTDWVQGELLFSGTQSATRLTLQRLDLAGLAGLELPAAAGGGAPELPDLDVSVRDLLSDGKSLGRLDFQLRSDRKGLRAENITGLLAGLRIEPRQPGQLRWSRDGASATQLDLHFAFDDLGDTLETLGYQRVLETEAGTMDLAMGWPGSPPAFSLQSTRGSLLLDTASGSFLEAPAGASGALRVVGILDLANIVRRLSLSHMFESGIPFETMTGEIYFHGDTIELAHLDVRGGASRFQLSGVSQVESRTMDGELVATLPVASNLPWVAALAGGLPVAAGVFVVSKVFEKQFDTLSSAVYRIEGTWDDPEVDFDRIWDDAKTMHPASAGAVPPGQTGAPDPQDAAGGIQP